MDKALLDTDIFSEVLKGVDREVASKASHYRIRLGRCSISTVTIVEIVKGPHKLQHEDRVKQFLAGLADVQILALDLGSSELAGRMYADLERTGQPIGRTDPMIAGIALKNGLVLVSGNVSHYQRIQALGYELRPETWRTGA